MGCPTGAEPIKSEKKCSYCKKGYAKWQNSNVMCRACPARQFQDEIGQKFCKDCPLGFKSINPASKSCDVKIKPMPLEDHFCRKPRFCAYSFNNRIILIVGNKRKV